MQGRQTTSDEVIRLVDGVLSEASGQRRIVLSADGSTMHTLNAVGASIVEMLPSERSRILAGVAERYADVDLGRLADDLDEFIGELTDAGLIARADADR